MRRDGAALCSLSPLASSSPVIVSNVLIACPDFLQGLCCIAVLLAFAAGGRALWYHYIYLL